MNFANYLQFLEPVQDHVSRMYSTTSEIITVVLVIWLLNFLAGIVQKTFASGRAFGIFYRNYLHQNLKALMITIVKIIKKTPNEKSNKSSSNSYRSRQLT